MFKGVVHLKMKMSLFTHPHVISNPSTVLMGWNAEFEFVKKSLALIKNIMFYIINQFLLSCLYLL